MRQGEIDRNPAAERQAHDVRVLHLEVVEQTGEVVRVGEWLPGQKTPAITAYIIPNDRELLGKDGELVIPHSTIHLPAVDQHQSRSCAFHLVEDAGSADGSETVAGQL